MGNTRVRKQVYELTAADLDRHPVWEFALDEEGAEGQDEATVRPFNASGTLDPSDGMFIVRARLTLADGTRVIGYMTPAEEGEVSLGTLQPAVIAATGQVQFWWGTISLDPTDIAANYARLGKASKAEVFPIHFISDVPLARGPVEGEIPGFLVLEDIATMRTKVVT